MDACLELEGEDSREKVRRKSSGKYQSEIYKRDDSHTCGVEIGHDCSKDVE